MNKDVPYYDTITTKVGVSLSCITVVTHVRVVLEHHFIIESKMSKQKSLSDLLKANGLTEKDLNQQMKEKHCHEIAMQVGKDWETLATSIGMSDTDVDDIKARYQEPRDRRIALLRKWKKSYGKEATYAQMARGLEKIGNRELTEYLIGLLKRKTLHNQKESYEISQDSVRKTEKRRQHHNADCKSKVMFILALLLVLMCCISDLLTNISTAHAPPCTSHTQSNSSTAVQWSPKHYNSTNCSQPVGHDLPVIYDYFVGREDDIREIVRKAKNVNIFNINGAPGIGKSTVTIHAGYRLLQDCISVRYVNIDELSWKILSKFTDSKGNLRNKTGKFNHPKMQTAALTTFTDSLVTKEDLLDLEYYSTVESSFINQLKQWSKLINHTTVLILDNADIFLAGSPRTKFIDLITLLVHNSEFNLHVMIVSQEKLLLLENFNRWIVRELNQNASVELLNKLAPDLDSSQLQVIKIAELLQGYPMALKIIGGMLNVYGQDVTYELEDELQRRPIDVLDKVSDHRQRFSVMMDLALSKLEFLTECGYMVSLFPGSFSREAGIAILSSKECLEVYGMHSLLDEYSLAYQRRYKMHWLIREYLKEKNNSTDKILFKKRFCKYYTQFLVNYANKSEISDIDECVLSSESKNIDLFEEILLSNSQRNFSIEELATFAFLVSQSYVEIEKLQGSFKLYLKNLNQVRELLNPIISGGLISHIVKHFYMRHQCGRVIESKIYNIFDCELITELFSMHSFLNLSKYEEEFLQTEQTRKCTHQFSFGQSILSFLHYKSDLILIAANSLLIIYFGKKDSLLYHIVIPIMSLFVPRLILFTLLPAIIFRVGIYLYSIDELLVYEVGMKMFCYSPCILLAVFIFICLCYYKLHPFPFHVRRLIIFLIQGNIYTFVLFQNTNVLLIYSIFLLYRCSQSPTCH